MTRIGRFVRRMLRMMEIPSESWRYTRRGYDALKDWPAQPASPITEEPNRLRAFFDGRREGPGIWKWVHYLDIYDRHLSRFRNQEVHFLEVGIFSGGSLEMWRDYLGPRARIYGVDLEPSCKIHERDGVKVFIGDQADPAFWQEFRRQVPVLDVVIDDGGHVSSQQIATLEGLLPHLRPGGVYICEDVHGAFNQFASYVHGIGHQLNDCLGRGDDPGSNDRRIVFDCTPAQAAIGSIHLYPYMTVLERNTVAVKELVCPKHGTQWQSFLR